MTSWPVITLRVQHGQQIQYYDFLAQEALGMSLEGLEKAPEGEEVVQRAALVALGLDGEELRDNERATKKDTRKMRAEMVDHLNVVKKFILQAEEKRKEDKKEAQESVENLQGDLQKVREEMHTECGAIKKLLENKEEDRKEGKGVHQPPHTTEYGDKRTPTRTQHHERDARRNKIPLGGTPTPYEKRRVPKCNPYL